LKTIVLSVLLLAGLQPYLAVDLSSSSVFPGGNVTVSASLSPSLPAIFEAYLYCGEEAISRATATSLTGIAQLTLEVPSGAEPGTYRVVVVALGERFRVEGEAELAVAPSLQDVAELAARAAVASYKAERAAEALSGYPEAERLAELRSSVLSGIHRLFELCSSGEAEEAAALYSRVQEDVRRLEKEVEEVSGAKAAVWSIARRVDESLEFNPAVAFRFWARLATASTLLLIALVVLFPLYSTGHLTFAIQVARELASKGEDIDSIEVVSAVEERAANALELAYSQASESLDARGLSMNAVAAVLATVGLLADNITAVIGSMLLAPLMSVFIAAAVGLSLVGFRKGEVSGELVFYTGLRAGLVGVAVVVLISWLTALASKAFVPLRLTGQLSARAAPNLADFGIALGAGLGGGIASTSRRGGEALAGAAVAIALVPPASAVGCGLAMLNSSLLLGSTALLTTNIIALLASGYLTAKMYIVYPVLELMYSRVKREVSEAYRGVPPASALLAFAVFLAELLELALLWVKLAAGVSASRGFTKAARALAERVARLATPFMLAVAAWALISTEASAFFSAPLALLFTELSQAAALLKLSWLAPLLKSFPAIALAAALLTAGVLRWASSARQGSKRSLSKLLAGAALLWVTLGYMLRAHMYSHVAASYTLALALGVAVWSSRRLWKARGRIAVYAFLVFTLLTLMAHSTEAYQRIYLGKVAAELEANRVVREAIAAYTGIPPERVEVDIEPTPQGWLAHVKVTADISELSKLQPAAFSEAEQASEIALQQDIQLKVEYRVVPGG